MQPDKSIKISDEDYKKVKDMSYRFKIKIKDIISEALRVFKPKKWYPIFILLLAGNAYAEIPNECDPERLRPDLKEAYYQLKEISKGVDGMTVKIQGCDEPEEEDNGQYPSNIQEDIRTNDATKTRGGVHD